MQSCKKYSLSISETVTGIRETAVSKGLMFLEEETDNKQVNKITLGKYMKRQN